MSGIEFENRRLQQVCEWLEDIGVSPIRVPDERGAIRAVPADDGTISAVVHIIQHSRGERLRADGGIVITTAAVTEATRIHDVPPPPGWTGAPWDAFAWINEPITVPHCTTCTCTPRPVREWPASDLTCEHCHATGVAHNHECEPKP